MFSVENEKENRPWEKHVQRKLIWIYPVRNMLKNTLFYFTRTSNDFKFMNGVGR